MKDNPAFARSQLTSNGHVSTNGSNGLIRFTRDFPCPVCGGCQEDPRGRGVRCAGYKSADGEWIHCVRDELAGKCKHHPKSQTWSHRAKGPCPCGKEHAPADLVPSKPKGARKAPPAYSTFEAAVLAQASYITRQRKVAFACTAAYAYTSSFRVARFDEIRGTEKDYRPFRLDDGGWRSLDPSGLLPLYLGECETDEQRAAAEAELAAADVVYVLEGEKCANLVRGLGLVAVTSSHGSNSADKTDWSPLGGKTVRLVPDKNSAGEKYIDDVGGLVAPLEPAPTIEVIRLDVGDDEDVQQWLENNDTLSVEACAKALAAAAQIWRPSPAGPAPSPAARVKPRARLTRVSDVATKRVEWLWPDRIPLGMLTLFAGDPKLGKSLCTVGISAAVSCGKALPMDPTRREPGSVIMMSAEDDLARVIKPRLEAAGACMDRVHVLESIIVPGSARGHGEPEQPPSERMPSILGEDIVAIEDAARELGDCRLIVIDPVTAYLSGVDDHRNTELRAVLWPLKAMAERLNAAVVLVTHMSKGGATQAKHRVIGSIAWVGACRANFIFIKDGNDPTGRRVLMCDNGSNLAPDVPTLSYSIEERNGGPVVAWGTEALKVTADEALQTLLRDSDQQADRRECDKWLAEILKEGDPVLVDRIEAAAKHEKLSFDAVKRAKARMGVASERDGFGKGSKVFWRLAKTPSEGANS
jgi:putative DNA primase/helicase